jgi:integrase
MSFDASTHHAASGGVPVHVMAARLGHADPVTILRVYARVIHEQAIKECRHPLQFTALRATR